MMTSPILYLDIPSQLLDHSAECQPTSLTSVINGSLGSIYLQKTKTSIRIVLQGSDLLHSNTDGWMCSSTINDESYNIPFLIQYFQSSMPLKDLSDNSDQILPSNLNNSDQCINISSSAQNNEKTEIQPVRITVPLAENTEYDKVLPQTKDENVPINSAIECCVCPVCAGVFDRAALSLHLRDNHANVSEDQLSELTEEDVVIGEKEEQEEGEDLHQLKQHLCKFCTENFTTKWSKYRHQGKCPNNPEALKCGKCGFITDKSVLYDDHMKNHDGVLREVEKYEEIKIMKAQKDSEKFLKDSLDEGIEILQQPLTKQLPDTPANFTGKMFTCKFCQAAFPKSWTRNRHQDKCPKNLNVLRILRCSLCGYTTKNSASYERHVQKHKGKSYDCALCGIKYSNCSGLYRHRRNAHGLTAHGNENQVYKCHECGKEMIEKHNYEVHIKRHAGIYDQICEHCAKSFKTSTDLQKHIRSVHHNRYLYHCEFCGHGVSKLSYLINHQCNRIRRIQTSKAEMPITDSNTTESQVNSFPPIDSFLSKESSSCLLMPAASESNTYARYSNVVSSPE